MLYDINWQGNKINIKLERKTSTRILEEGKEKNDEKFDIIYQHMSDTICLSSCIKSKEKVFQLMLFQGLTFRRQVPKSRTLKIPIKVNDLSSYSGR